MKKTLLFLSLLVITVLLIYSYQDNTRPSFTKPGYQDKHYSAQRKSGNIQTAKQKPGDWFYLQRAYPNDKIPDNAYMDAYNAVKKFNARAEKSALSSAPWIPAGPTNIPGRIPTLAVHPSEPSTIYAGSAAGGVFKSTDFGSTWTSIC